MQRGEEGKEEERTGRGGKRKGNKEEGEEE